jgi:hypothetical protein
MIEAGMGELLFVTGVGQILLPIALAFRLWRAEYCSRLEWFLYVLPAGIYLAFISVAGIWLLAPRCLLYGFSLLSLAAAVASWRRRPQAPAPGAGGFRGRFQAATNFALMAFCTGMLLLALNGYGAPPMPAIDMASPLRNGEFGVVNGGYSILINPHIKTLKRESLAAYRAQSYAVDIVKIDRFGMRAHGCRPADLTRYHIFGEPVFAPCSGVVMRIEDQLPDQIPSDGDPLHPAGNHVLLKCTEASVFLAHLKQSSISVKLGEWVHTGDYIGRVGNSGLSLEPHLHLHAQKGSATEDFLSSEPLPLKIEGRTLVRNSRFTSKHPGETAANAKTLGTR